MCISGTTDEWYPVIKDNDTFNMAHGTEFYLGENDVWVGRVDNGIIHEIYRFDGSKNLVRNFDSDCDINIKF